jgi:hypothetical protein
MSYTPSSSKASTKGSKLTVNDLTREGQWFYNIFTGAKTGPDPKILTGSGFSDRITNEQKWGKCPMVQSVIEKGRAGDATQHQDLMAAGSLLNLTTPTSISARLNPSEILR